MSETQKVIPLSHPIEVKGENGTETIDELLVGRLKLKHVAMLPDEIFDSDEGEINIKALLPVLPKLVAALTGQPLEIAEEVDIEDLEPIMEVLESFFGDIQGQSGDKSSGQ